jgi:23S rRNA pseudouridine2605 synthase
VKTASKKPPPNRRPPAKARLSQKRRPEPGGAPPAERLQKLLASAGLGSRRTIEGWIAAGRVTVAGRTAVLGERARAGDSIEVDGRPVRLRASDAPLRVLLYHKPVGEMVTRRDPGGRRTVFERLPRLREGQWIAVGRLDLNTSGLLLFTDSGALANRLMHPRYEVEREYLVRVLGALSEATRRRLLQGVQLEDGKAAFERLEPLRAGAGAGSAANQWHRVVLREGRTREVRRLFEAVGLQVSRLMRVRFGTVRLPRGLQPGRWIELDPKSCAALLAAATAQSAAEVVPEPNSC